MRKMIFQGSLLGSPLGWPEKMLESIVFIWRIHEGKFSVHFQNFSRQATLKLEFDAEMSLSRSGAELTHACGMCGSPSPMHLHVWLDQETRGWLRKRRTRSKSFVLQEKIARNFPIRFYLEFLALNMIKIAMTRVLGGWVLCRPLWDVSAVLNKLALVVLTTAEKKKWNIKFKGYTSFYSRRCALGFAWFFTHKSLGALQKPWFLRYI